MRLIRETGWVPVRVLLRAVWQWARLAVLLVLRRVILNLPLWVAEWLAGKTDFAWLGDRLTCDAGNARIRYWGGFAIVDTGWTLTECVMQDGRVCYGLRAVVRVGADTRFQIQLGYRLKPGMGFAFGRVPVTSCVRLARIQGANDKHNKSVDRRSSSRYSHARD